MSSIIETGIDYKKIDDVRYMKSYVMRLNDDIKYMLTNLDPEDNFDTESQELWKDFNGSTSGLQQSSEELQIAFVKVNDDLTEAISQRADGLSVYLQKGSVTSEINLSTEKIKISASRLRVESDNFTLIDNDLTINGQIQSNEGTIGDFTITTENGNPYLNGESSGVISGGSLEGTTGIFKSFSCKGTSSTDMSNMLLSDATVNIRNCRITSTGMVFTGEFYVDEDLNAATYVPSTESYTNRVLIEVEGKVYTEQNIWVEQYSGTTDSGLVQCYSVWSYIEGSDYSDQRLKDNLERIDGKTALEFIKEVDPVHYKLIDEDTDNLGVIAQDIVHLQDKYADYGLIDVNEDGYYTVSYKGFIPLMAAAIKEMEGEIHGIY